MMPSPPCRAMATAIRASVTVSIGEEIRGTRTVTRLDTREVVVTWDGITSLSVGWSSTSSNVRPSRWKGCGTPATLRSSGGSTDQPFARRFGGLHAISVPGQAPPSPGRGRSPGYELQIGGEQGVEDLAPLLGLLDQRTQLVAGPVLGDSYGIGAHAELL